MPHLTNLPPNPPEEFSMLKEIFDQQVFELCIHEENGQKAYYIPYIEYFGETVPRFRHNEYRRSGRGYRH